MLDELTGACILWSTQQLCPNVTEGEDDFQLFQAVWNSIASIH